MYTVYVLYNSTASRVYIGQTKDIIKRLNQHNSGTNKKHHTAKFQGKWELIYQELVATRSEAIKREKQLKSSRGREFAKKFVPE